MNSIDLSGRVAVVTGGARGIGFAVAKRFERSGARVALWDRDGHRVAHAACSISGAIGVQVDVTSVESVEAALNQTASQLGCPNILVNSAAIAGRNFPVAEYSLEVWREIIDVNLTGVFICCRALISSMKSVGYGRIVNIASIAGKEGNPNAAAYSSAKAGVIGFTKSLGKELAENNILVNCITPSVINTEILEGANESHLQYLLSKVPMKRLGTVEEVSALVAWLASEECSFSTGAVFDISGGRATY